MAWRAARSLIVLRDQINAAYPQRNKASDGTIGDAAHAASVSDHNPDGSGVVRALDITHDPAHGCDIDKLTDQLAASRDSRISYLIANRLITGPDYGWSWATYYGDDPHTNHFHLSVVSDSRADDTRQWSLNLNTGGIAMPSGDAEFVASHVSVVDSNGEVTDNICGAHTALSSIWSEIIKTHKDVKNMNTMLVSLATALTALTERVDAINAIPELDYVKLVSEMIKQFSAE